MKAIALNAVVLSLIFGLTLVQGSPPASPPVSAVIGVEGTGEGRSLVTEGSLVPEESRPQVTPTIVPTANAPEVREPEAAGAESAIKDIFPRFSIVGDWQITHPQWTDLATIQPDGTITTRRQQTAGRWFLAGDGGTPLLVIRWDLFGTESVSMVDLDHFRGQTRSGRFIDMRRSTTATR